MYLPPDVTNEIIKQLRVTRKNEMYRQSVNAILSIKQHTSRSYRTTTGKVVTRNSVEVGPPEKSFKYLITKSYGALGIVSTFNVHQGEPDDYHYTETAHFILPPIVKKK